MTVTISPEQERLIREAMQTGAYKSADEVVAHALELLRSGEQWLESEKTAIASKIETALKQFERGDVLSPEQSRADMANRKAKWFAQQQG